MVAPGPKLGHWKQTEGFDVAVEALGNDLLEDLPDALQEADGAVGLQVAVVRLVGLVKGNDGGVVPRVGTGGEAQVKDVSQHFGLGGMGPF